MKSLAFVLIFLAIALKPFCQIIFEPGYIISNDGRKTNCLVKNADWENNPSEFIYKLSEFEPAQVGKVASIAGFGIGTQSRYERFTVQIDQSSEISGRLSFIKEPEYKEQQVFLKLIAAGKARLFKYQTNDFTRYMLGVDSLPVEQLIYKRYLSGAGLEGINETYKQQLWTKLRCGQLSITEVEALEFKEQQLVETVEMYNRCNKGTTTTYSRTKPGVAMHLNIRPGINYAAIVTSNEQLSFGTQDFGYKVLSRFGVEGEFIMPFNKNKWAALTEVSYQYYNSLQKNDLVSKKADYKYIELAPGIRYYFFLKNKSKLFFDANLSFQLPINSSVQINSANIKISRSFSVGGGAGFTANKFGVELRYTVPRNISNSYITWNSRYFTSSLILSYTIL